tara:strand:+ start:2724 stop:7433 length:4710 start_codon:yes stop_codon:yes gene_type:complete
MSGGTNYTQMSYECSRQNASITYGEDFSEWENEFKEGIQLKKGDQVRLLGSFVHQGSTSEEIEVEQNMELNIAYSPFIVADTIDTLDTTADGTLQDLSDIGDIAYSTDSFGIEPPCRVTTQNGVENQLNSETDIYHQADFSVGAQKSFPSEDAPIAEATHNDGKTLKYIQSAYSDPATTGERGGDYYGQPLNFWSINSTVRDGAGPRTQMEGDSAEVFGMNIKTDTLFTDNNKVRQDYSNFATGKANCEMYIGNMVKKLILPVFKRFTNFNPTADPKGTGTTEHFRILDDLVDDPPSSGIGMLNGMPKVGMCIATVNIAQTSGWYDANGNAYWENTWDADGTPSANYDGTITGGTYTYAGTSGYTGIPNLAGGVESVIGTIIATRPILHNIMGKSEPCWEIMVSDFVNPASLSDKPIIKQFDINKLTRADTYAVDQGGFKVNCFKKIHGSGTTETNANYNPSLNNINGAFNQITQGRTYPSEIDGYKSGMMSSTPTRNNYLLNKPVNGPNFRTQFENGGTGVNASFNDMGLGQNQGLSFLWNGSHTGYLRYNSTVSNVDRYRANHLLQWGRVAGFESSLVAKSKINDIRLTAAPGPISSTSFFRDAELMEMGSVPVCFGAYIICKKETMLDIATGGFTDINQYWDITDGNQPRIWFDYAFQQTDSSYTTRHYKGNSYDTSKIVTGNAVGGDDTVFPRGGGATGDQAKTPPFVTDNRFGYAMCGRPLNINYRNSSGENGTAIGTPGQTINDTFTLSGNSGQNQRVKLSSTDFMPRYFNTITGESHYDGSGPNGGLAPNDDVAHRGLPGVWGGYNTTINSIYFQQKETGDTKLGSTSTLVNGFCHVTTNIVAVNNVIEITKATLLRSDNNALYTPVIGNYLRIVGVNDCQYHNVSRINNVADGGLFFTITIGSVTAGTGRFFADIPQGTAIIVSSGPSYMPNAVGINGNAWAGDHILIKEQFVKLKVDSGFYTEEQLAERINDQLHFNTLEFKQRFGIKNANGTYSLPTTNGNKERALTSQPSILNGNFVNTYIPDINYAFAPITTTNATELGLTASTKDITNEILTYEPIDATNITYYWSELLPTETTADTYIRKLTDHSEQYPTILGKHFKMYTIPSMDKQTATLYKEISLMRLKGGSLNTQLDFIQDNPTSATVPPPYWHNKKTRFAGSYEMLRDFTFSSTDSNFPETNSTMSTYSYRTRFTRNVFPAGGSARVFCGANNFTFSWEQGANRYSFNNLYTPVRPHKPETNGTDAKEDFGIGDAIPSAIINSRPNGTIISQLSGIYINNLNGDLFTQQNWGTPSIGNDYQYDLITTQERIFKNTTFLNILGYTLNQVLEFDNSFNDVVDIFLYRDYLTQNGSAIRVGAKVTTAINASNPIASKCLIIAPVTQFMVQVDTDDFFANNAPLKGNDPYFFIGSTFPFKQFHGNQNGGKLPIMGICARNFQAFGFSFDLGGSAVSYLIEADTTITSIRTKIYTSNLQTPTNLSPYSSIIYLITRYDYLKNLTPQQGELQLQQTIANMNRPMINAFNSPPLAMARTAPPVNPDRYYYTGYPTNQMETIEEEEEDY